MWPYGWKIHMFPDYSRLREWKAQVALVGGHAHEWAVGCDGGGWQLQGWDRFSHRLIEAWLHCFLLYMHIKLKQETIRTGSSISASNYKAPNSSSAFLNRTSFGNLWTFAGKTKLLFSSHFHVTLLVSLKMKTCCNASHIVEVIHISLFTHNINWGTFQP